MMGGNWGRILEVDLSSGTTQVLELNEKLYRDYLGGSGLAAKLFFDRQGWFAEPLSPQNPLMIMLGPISGLNLPGAARLEICARSPLTGIWGESCMGGHFAPQLKRTGYDGVIVTGASDRPVYLYVSDEKVETKDASHLWGVDTYETEEKLRTEVGDKRAQVICIGLAGENMVKYANIMNDRGSTAGRCGMGAVMGSKKLKAVVVRGNKEPYIADGEGFRNASNELSEKIKASPIAMGFGAYGTNMYMSLGMAVGDVPVKNWREPYWDDGKDRLGGEAVAENILIKTHSCYGCSVGCKRIVKVDSGPFAMQEGPGSEYETAAALGTLQRMDSMEANNKANELCNRYGMDTISTGGTIAYATEAFEAGLIVEGDTGGIKLGWNQPDTLLLLIEKIAQREGFGNDLAEGVRAMSEKYGGEDFALHVKGLEVPMHDPRALWGMALTYATSVRGACHVADANTMVELGLADHEDLGVKKAEPYQVAGRAAQTIASQQKVSILNSTVMCAFTSGGSMPFFAELINLVTGSDLSVDELARTGDRIWYLKRAIGNLCGVTREADQVPERVIKPHVEGKTMRYFPGLEEEPKPVPFMDMLMEYYQLRDIDAQGRPSRKVLEALGMEDVAAALHS